MARRFFSIFCIFLYSFAGACAEQVPETSTSSDADQALDVGIKRTPERVRRHEKVKMKFKKKVAEAKKKSERELSVLSVLDDVLFYGRRLISYVTFIAGIIVILLMLLQIEAYYKNPRSVALAHIMMYFFVVCVLFVISYML